MHYWKSHDYQTLLYRVQIHITEQRVCVRSPMSLCPAVRSRFSLPTRQETTTERLWRTDKSQRSSSTPELHSIYLPIISKRLALTWRHQQKIPFSQLHV